MHKIFRKLLIQSSFVWGLSSVSAQTTLVEQYNLDFGSPIGVNGNKGYGFGYAAADRNSAANGAVEFVGVNSMNLGRPSISMTATGGFSIAFWVKVPTTLTGTTNLIMSNRAVCTVGNQLNIYANATDKKIAFSMRNDVGTAFTLTVDFLYTPDTWHHVIFTVDNSTRQGLGYKDGVLSGFAGFTGTTGTIASIGAGDLQLSNSPCVGLDATTRFKGFIDDVRLYKGVLTSTEATALAALATPSPVKNYSANDLLVYSDNMGLDCSVTGVGNTYTTDRANNAGSAILFSGTNTGVDHTRTNSVNPLAKIFSEGTSFTISAWIKLTGTEVNGFIVSNYVENGRCGNTGQGRGGAIRILDNKLNMFLVHGNAIAQVTGNSVLNPGTWYHVAGSVSVPYFGTNSFKLYVNGINETITSATTTSATGSIIASNPAIPTSIGGNISSTNVVCNNAYSFEGAIDDVKIYKNVLTPTEVAALSQETATPSDSVKLNDRIAYAVDFNDFTNLNSFSKSAGAVLAEDRFGNANSAVNFNTTHAYLNPNKNIDTVTADGDPFAFSAWIKPTALMSNNIIIGHGADGGCSENTRQLYFRIMNGKVNFTAVFASNGTSTRSFDGGTLLLPNNWYHVAVVVNQPIVSNSDVKIYVNGVAETLTVTVTGTGTGSLPISNSLLGIGNYLRSTGTTAQIGTNCNATTDGSFKGFIDDVRIYDRYLCTQDIAKLYTLPNPKLTTSINSDVELKGLSVYPNPSETGSFFVSNGKVLNVSRLDGTEVDFKQDGQVLSLADQNVGMYFAKITTDNKILVIKIQVSR